MENKNKDLKIHGCVQYKYVIRLTQIKELNLNFY